MQFRSVQNDNIRSRTMEEDVKMDLTNNEEFQKWSKEFDEKMKKLQQRVERLERSMHEDPEKQLKLWHLWHNEKTDEN